AICRQSLRLPFACRRCQRRNFPIARLDDEGRTPGLRDFRSAVVPEIVVCPADILFGGTVATVHVISLPYVGLLVGGFLIRSEDSLTGKLRRALEGGDRREAPDALQIGPAVGCTWNGNFGGRLAFHTGGALCGGTAGHYADAKPGRHKRAKQTTSSLDHMVLLFPTILGTTSFRPE